VEFKDYYETLGVPRDATAADIKKAFRKLARKYHPDVSKEKDADARMKEINEANAVLSDPEKRAAYDRLGDGYRPGQDFQTPPGWDGGFQSGEPQFSEAQAREFSEFFKKIFGDRAGPGPRGAGPRQREFHGRGEDHHAQVMLDLEETFLGATRKISLRVPHIDAQGYVALETKTLNVQIPKGIRDGQVVRLAGQGAPGFGDGPAGDLLLEVHFAPHPRFRVDGRDVHLTLPVAPWEAALGGVVPVTTVDGGQLNVRIPEGAQSGRQMRVRGKGIPSDPPGDLMLTLQVVLPPASTPRARELYEEMSRDLAFDPRSGQEV